MLCEEDLPPNMMSKLMGQTQNRKPPDVFDPAVATNARNHRNVNMFESHIFENNDCNVLQQS